MLSFVDEEASEDKFLLSSVSNGFSCSSNVSMSFLVFPTLRTRPLGCRLLRKGVSVHQWYLVIGALFST